MPITTFILPANQYNAGCRDMSSLFLKNNKRIENRLKNHMHSYYNKDSVAVKQQAAATLLRKEKNV